MITHYERYTAISDPHNAKASKAIRLFELLSKEYPPLTSGRWLQLVMDSRVPIKIGNETIDFISGGLDAFIIALHDMWYRQNVGPNEPYSFAKTLLCNPEFARNQAFLSKRMGNNQAHSLAEMLYQVLSHRRTGKKVYEVTPGLAEKLVHTELRGLTSADVRLPFANIYITVPANTGFQVYNRQTGWHDVEGVYLTEDKIACREPKQTILNSDGTITTSDNISYTDRSKVREWSVMVVGSAAKDAHGKPIPYDDALFYFKMYFEEGATIDDAINDVERRQENVREAIKDTSSAIVIENMRRTWRQLFKWCLNVVIYATYSEPGELIIGNPEARKLWARIAQCPVGSRTRKNLEAKAEGIDPKRRILLGKNITIMRNKPMHEQQGKGSTTRPITVRTLVTGHWKSQFFGKDRAFRKQIFIEPFWRGPDEANESNKRRVLK